MDVYTGDSSVCRAALHAGAIDAGGGSITVFPEKGRESYAGVTRNGVRSRNFGSYKASFRIPVPEQARETDEKPVQQPIAATIEEKGEVALYVRFRFNSADLDVDATPVLTELRETLAATPELGLTLVGHTDAIGTAEYNRSLSVRRARRKGDTAGAARRRW